MSLIHRLKRKAISFRAPKDVLKREIYYLHRAIEKSEYNMQQYHDRYPGWQCLQYEFPEYFDLEDHLDRQRDMLSHLERKVGK
jgi:hypothetical protein